MIFLHLGHCLLALYHCKLLNPFEHPFLPLEDGDKNTHLRGLGERWNEKIICEVLGTEPGTLGMLQRYLYFPAPSPTFRFSPGSSLLSSLYLFMTKTPQTWATSLPEMTLQSSHQQRLANNIFLKGISITLDKAIKTFLPTQGVSPQGPASQST